VVYFLGERNVNLVLHRVCN